MSLNGIRVFIIQAISFLIAMILFFITLSLLFAHPDSWGVLFLIPGIGIAAYFCMTLFTIGDVMYSSDSFFALYVMREEDRQWHFHYARDHPKENCDLGVYRLIGYKISEAR